MRSRDHRLGGGGCRRERRDKAREQPDTHKPRSRPRRESHDQDGSARAHGLTPPNADARAGDDREVPPTVDQRDRGRAAARTRITSPQAEAVSKAGTER